MARLLRTWGKHRTWGIHVNLRGKKNSVRPLEHVPQTRLVIG